MHIKTKNKLTIITGSLLLAALLVFLLGGPGILLNSLLLIATLLSGMPISVRAFQALRMRAFSIELLVTIAIAGALIIGELTEAAVVSFLFLFGDFLEGRTLEKTRSSLRSLIDLSPQKATVLRNGERLLLSVEEVLVGDRVIVQPGGKIPVDGKVISGQSLVNEATITGESVPSSKKIGDWVYSSTIADNGYLEIKAEKVGDDTTFSKIIELVEEAQETKAETQKFMERFATYYTPGIIILSVLVGLITQNIHLGLTFLVIACPGALVISVPVSIVAGIGNAAKNGILIKGGDKMENLAKLNTIVFDKTGTLTKGTPEVTAIKPFGIKKEELLKLSAEVEVASEHHLAKAILNKAKENGIHLENKPEQVEIIKGHGIQAVLTGHSIYIGNKSGAEKLQVPISPEVDNLLLKKEKMGNTTILISREGIVLGIIAIADQIREEAPKAIARLKNTEISKTVMLTGDNENVARQVALRLGIDRIEAELLPEDKVEKIKKLMLSNKNLAMVGDGVNDAPAIATANVGIAMGGTATDVTMETADVILMNDKLDKLPYALSLAKATTRNMMQNTYFALITVFLLLIGVLTDKVHLASGMLLHEISVILVILNAVRLVYFPRYQVSFKPLGLGTMKKQRHQKINAITKERLSFIGRDLR